MHPEHVAHPEHLYLLYRQRVADADRHHRRLEGLAPRPRPPGRLRRQAADLLVRLAARLADEPMVALPQRADAAGR